MSKNVFRDLGFDDEEAAGLKLKSYLFMALQEIIRHSGMTQKEIAEAIDADQPKVSKILNGKFSEFSIERITEYLQKLGYDIHVGTVPSPRKQGLGTVVLDTPVLRPKTAERSRKTAASTSTSKPAPARKRPLARAR